LPNRPDSGHEISIRTIRKIRIQKAFLLFGSGPGLLRALALAPLTPRQARPDWEMAENRPSALQVTTNYYFCQEIFL
jgi:hypothetical protein